MSRCFGPALLLLLGGVALVAQSPAPPRDVRERAWQANNLGVAYLEQFDYAKAAAQFEAALGVDPTLVPARVNLAIAHLYAPDLPAAQKAAMAAAAAPGAPPHADFLVGLIARSENREADALAAFRRVLQADPDDVASLVNVGQLLLQRREYAEAVPVFSRAVELEPYNVSALYNLAVAQTRAGQRELGAETTRKFQALRETGYGTTYSNTYLEQGRYAEAILSTGAEADLAPATAPALTYRSARLVWGASSRVQALAAGDVDRDGRTDYIVASDAGLDVAATGPGTSPRRLRATPWPLPAALGTRGIAMADVDNDGRPDLLLHGRGGIALWRQKPGSGNAPPDFEDVTRTSGITTTLDVRAAALVDLDHDGDADVVFGGATRDAAAPAPLAAWRNNGDGTFTDISASALPGQSPLVATAIVPTDVDLRRDIDVLVLGDDGRIRVWRNMRDATFREVAASVGLDALPPASAIAVGDATKDGYPDVAVSAKDGTSVLAAGASNNRFTAKPIAALPAGASAAQMADADNDGLLDIVVLVAGGPRVIRQAAGGTFEDVSQRTGLGTVDVNIDRHERPGSLAGALKTDRQQPGAGAAAARQPGSEGVASLQPGSEGVSSQQSRSGGAASRQPGSGVIASQQPGSEGVSSQQPGSEGVSSQQPRSGGIASRQPGSGGAAAGQPGSRGAGQPGFVGVDLQVDALLLLDADRSGSLDLVTLRDGALSLHIAGGVPPGFRVTLTGQVSNRTGVGSKVEMRAGSLWQKLETSATSPAAAPADLLFGLGSRPAIDVVRVLWPAGIVQAEPLSAEVQKAARLEVVELDRKPSSCPYLYTWTGDRFEFVTDFLGGGEMGYQIAPGVYSTPDPEEYVRIRGDRLRPRDGRYELRVTNELEETLFLDHLSLVAVDHPSGTDVYPREGMVSAPSPGLRLETVRARRPAARVIDAAGRDATAAAARTDRAYVDGLPLLAVRGYAKPHAITVDLGSGTPSRGAVLLLTGWTDYAFSSDNVAASQAGHALHPPSLQVRNARGEWQTVIEEIGVPVGRPQTIVVDLTDRFVGESREVRIATTMRVYWDQVEVATREAAVTPVVTRLDGATADLRWRGFSAPVSDREPLVFDYAKVTPHSPWKQMPGRYTREGDVRDLLATVDDRFVVARPGDEVALAFEAAALPALREGWSRTFLLHGDGFSKEMDINSASPDQAWPLPSHSMTRYPTPASTLDEPAWFTHYNTRVVGRQVNRLAGAPR